MSEASQGMYVKGFAFMHSIYLVQTVVKSVAVSLFLLLLVGPSERRAFAQSTAIELPQNLSGVWLTEPSTGFTARSSLTACLINNKIYAMGGYHGSTYLNTLEVFDLATNTWSTPVTTGTFTPRRGLTSALVDSKIYVMGGYNGVTVLNTLEVFDPATNAWSTPKTTGIFTAREKLCCAVVDGKIYAMGGYNGSVHLNTVEVFDPLTKTWSTPTTTGTFTPRRGLAASVVSGKIYVMGGYNSSFTDPYVNTLEVFDPVTSEWSTPTTTGTFTARGALCSSVVGGKIYAIGGVHLVSGTYYALNTLEVFDPANNIWSTPTTSGTFTPRYSSGCSLALGKIHVIGGENVSTALGVHESFTPSDMEVTDARQSGSIQLFPNPTTGIVRVHDIPNFASRIIVSNLLGKTVLSVPGSHDEEFSLDLSKLSSGVYFVRFVSANSVITRLVVRE